MSQWFIVNKSTIKHDDDLYDDSASPSSSSWDNSTRLCHPTIILCKPFFNLDNFSMNNIFTSCYKVVDDTGTLCYYSQPGQTIHWTWLWSWFFCKYRTTEQKSMYKAEKYNKRQERPDMFLDKVATSLLLQTKESFIRHPLISRWSWWWWGWVDKTG